MTATMDIEKPETAVKHAEDVDSTEEDPGVVTLKTWIVVVILSIGYGLSFWPIPCNSGGSFTPAALTFIVVFAAIQGQVAAEMGTPTKYIWWIPSWSLAITVSFLIL
jgi:hypothetical protein